MLAERFAPLTGVMAVALLVPGVVLLSSGAPKYMMAGPERYRRYYELHQDDIRAGGVAMILSVFLLLWFLGSVRAHLRAHEGGDSRVSAIAYSGGTLGVVCVLLAVVVKIAPALRLDASGALDGAHALWFSDTAGVLFGVASPVCFAALTAGCAVIGFRFRALPAWLSWLSAALAVLLVVPFLGWIGLLVLPVWSVLLSIHLYRTLRSQASSA
jgi:hypothetical protein